MDYKESDHLTDKETVVKKTYDRLITELKKIGQLKIEPKRQAYILEIVSASREFTPDRII